uniref:LCP family protein n=1 Tax=Petrachloros mirabilis TaxID=2918835 RepID=UPI00308428E5
MNQSITVARGREVRGVMRWLIWGVLFGSVVTISAVLGAGVAMLVPIPSDSGNAADGSFAISDLFRKGFQYGVSRPVNILVMGVDDNPDAPPDSPEAFQSRSDTMLLVRINPRTDQVSILSIPRDTQVDISGYGTTKMNHANWYGGAELALDVVSQTLNGVSIDRYVRVNTEAFRELVDVVGGVEVHVPQRMYYVDQTQGLTIDLQPGQQVLNGEQAEGFVRFRQDDLGDIGRAQRQQMVLAALQKRLVNPLTLPRLPQVMAVLQKYIDTDLSLGELLALMQFGLQLKSDQTQMVLLPGRFSGAEEYELSYWLLDLERMDRVMQTYFDVSPPVGYEVVPMDPTYDYSLRIVVQNASGNPDGGYKMVDYLYSRGFHNVELASEDWSQVLTDTQIIPQWGALKPANRIQGLLDQSKVAVNSTGLLDSDLTVRVGYNWLASRQARSVR